eukprot:3048947-Prymnesium_polylepis.1
MKSEKVRRNKGDQRALCVSSPLDRPLQGLVVHSRRLLKRQLAGTARLQLSRRSAWSSEIRALCRGTQQILSTPQALEPNRVFVRWVRAISARVLVR